jgi:hypothetical protein
MGDTCRFAHIPSHLGSKRPVVDEGGGAEHEARRKQRRTFTD